MHNWEERPENLMRQLVNHINLSIFILESIELDWR